MSSQQSRGARRFAPRAALVRAVLLAVLASLAASCALAGPALASVTFSVTPASDTNDSSATFVFSGGSAPYTCSTDGGTFALCTSPVYLSGLSEGAHSLRVHDSCSNACNPQTTYDWTTDYTPPSVVLTSQPAATTNQTSASFGFSSTDATATFMCSLNGAAYAACTSPRVYSGLGAGTRQFNVESVDPAGNVSLTTGSASWTVDLTPPVTTIATSVDKAHSTVAVTLSSSISGSTFQCSVDSQAYASCQSSFTLTPPAVGQNSLAVKATSPAGNVETTPATASFNVYPAPPAPTVTLLTVPTPPAHPTKHAAGDEIAAAGPGISYQPPKIAPVITGGLEGRWALNHTTRLQFSDAAANDVDHYEIARTVSIGPDLLDAGSTFYGASSGAVLISLPNGTTCYSVVAVSPDGNDSPATSTCTSTPFGSLALNALNNTPPLSGSFELGGTDLKAVTDHQAYEGGYIEPGPLTGSTSDPLVYYTGTLECLYATWTSIGTAGSCDEATECASSGACTWPSLEPNPAGVPQPLSDVTPSDSISDVAIVATACPSCGSVQIDLSARANGHGEPAQIAYKHVLNLKSATTRHSVLFDLPGLGTNGKPDDLLWISRRSGTPRIEGVGWIPNAGS